jgi:hypothetical protein
VTNEENCWSRKQTRKRRRISGFWGSIFFGIKNVRVGRSIGNTFFWPYVVHTEYIFIFFIKFTTEHCALPIISPKEFKSWVTYISFALLYGIVSYPVDVQRRAKSIRSIVLYFWRSKFSFVFKLWTQQL